MRRASSVSFDLLARERRIQHQRAGEQKRDPEQARAVAARFGGGRLECKAEKHDDDQREDHRGREKLARAKFEAKLFREQNRGGAGGVQLHVVSSRYCPASSRFTRVRPAAGADRRPGRYRARSGRRRARLLASRGRAIRFARACSSSPCSRSSRSRSSVAPNHARPWRSSPAAGSSSSSRRGPCKQRASDGQPLPHAARETCAPGFPRATRAHSLRARWRRAARTSSRPYSCAKKVRFSSAVSSS